ncbi:protein multipolar spindle 1 isoform X2 [Tanacetum coccineum]
MPACLISGIDYEYFVSFKFELLDDDISWDPSLCNYVNCFQWYYSNEVMNVKELCALVGFLVWELRPNDDISGGDGGRFTNVLCRRFLRQVRLKEIRKSRSEGSARRLYFSVVIRLLVLIVLVENNDEETKQLRDLVDFPVDLCDTIFNVREFDWHLRSFIHSVLQSNSLFVRLLQPDDANFTNWSHQSVDFILDSIKNITSHGKIIDSVEGIIGSLSLLLVRKMCTTLQGDGDLPESSSFDIFDQIFHNSPPACRIL